VNTKLQNLTLVLLLALSLAVAPNVHAQDSAAIKRDAYATTLAYVVQFYPLWFTYEQSKIAPTNRLAGPDQISPIYQIVVAINDDTLYASTFVDLREQPLILTLPATTATYSILTLDPYGDIFDSGIVEGTPGTYALTGPGWTGTLPAGVTPIAIPISFSTLIFRADKFSASGEDQTDQANLFRESLTLATLSDYLIDPTTGATTIFPEILFAEPFKTAADDLIASDPITFLKQLQEAVGSTNTPPLSPYEELLSTTFDGLFGSGGFTKQFVAGAQKAHALIVDRYLSHTDPTNWINFTNIGAWGDQVIERSSITEYIQYGNGHSTAAYYHAFKDGRGAPLHGSNSRGYVLTFHKGQLPQAKRFWSLTAYTPDSIELVPNSANKYVVASYTPGLETSSDGSVSIYMSPRLPPGVPAANWLPVPLRPFNIMLRVYGPEGSVADGTYLPPAIVKFSQ
jgi:hypothetical protein